MENRQKWSKRLGRWKEEGRIGKGAESRRGGKPQKEAEKGGNERSLASEKKAFLGIRCQNVEYFSKVFLPYNCLPVLRISQFFLL